MPRRKKAHRAAWASITRVDDGRYRIRYWGKDSNGQYRRMSRTVRGNRLDAERVRSELMLEHSEDAPCPTVTQAWERWVLPDMERRVEDGDLAPKSLEQYSSAWRKHVEPMWGSVACDAVRPLAVQQWISKMGRSPAISATQVLSKVMDYAVRYEFCDHNPMREKYLMPSQSTVEKQDPGIWDVQQLMDEWDSCRGAWYEPAFILAAFGGMRVGESLAPLAGDVDAMVLDGVDVCAIPVINQMPNRGKKPTPKLKTRQSERVAVVVGPAARRLAEIAASIPADWPLTHDGAGGFQNQTRLSRSWTGAHPFRNLRNSYQTWHRYDLRAPRWLTKRLMGHKGEDVEDAYYDRPNGARLAEIVADLYRERPVFG